MKMKRSRNLCYRLLLMLAVVFFALDVSAQTTINGQVKDDMGEAVIGASIVVKGTSNGTVTDFDGNFTLKCQSGAKLVITYIGYTPQEVAAKDGMQVTLKRCPAQRGCRRRLWLYGQEGNLQLCGSDFQGSVQPGCRQRRDGTGSR